MSLDARTIRLIKSRPGIKSREIAKQVGANKRRVNSLLYNELKALVVCDESYGWHLRDSRTPHRKSTTRGKRTVRAPSEAIYNRRSVTSSRMSRPCNKENKPVVERIFAFAAAVRNKNGAIGAALQRAMIPLLEYARPLTIATRDELLGIGGIGQGTVSYIQRIIAAEDVETVVADVPVVARTRRQPPTSYQSKEYTNWDGSWDNTVRRIEGE